MTVRLTVLSTVSDVAAEQKKALPELNDDLVLMHTELDSLCFAIIVARLEDQLGVDPFSAAREVYFPVTLGDLVALYEHALV